MDDEMNPGGDWLDTRLKAAARDAQRVPRRRLLLNTTAPERRAPVGWVGRHRLVLGLLVLNAATGAASIALGVSLSQRAGGTQPPTASPAQLGPPPGSRAGVVTLDFGYRGDTTAAPPPIVVAFGSVWIVNAETGDVLRIDERSLTVTATVRVASTAGGGATDLASDGVSLWASAGSAHAVVRIDPQSNRVVDSIAVPSSPGPLAVSGTSLWVSTSSVINAPATLVAVDTARHSAVASFPIGSRTSQLSLGRGAVWVDNAGEGTLTRLDIASGRLTTTVVNRADYDFGYVAVAADATGAWAVDNNSSVLEHVDAGTMSPGSAIGVGLARDTATSGKGPLDVTLGDGAEWVVTGAQLVRIDARSGVTAAMDVPRARAVTAGDGAIWVVVGDRSSAGLVKVVPAG